MKIHTDAAAHRVVIVIAAVLATLAAWAVPTASAASASGTHSRSGPCVRASVLAFRDRHAIADRTHFVGAVDVALAHRHTPCAALVDYLKLSAA
jgi:hypothetical protein